MTIEEIRELIQTVVASGVAELEVQRGENRVWIKRSVGVVTQEIHVPQATVAPMTNPAMPPAPAHAAATPPPPPAVKTDTPDLTDPALQAIKSPIVGTFYEAPAPGAEPFVRAGDIVSPGKILCIIESMKLMNEIECEVSGTIVKRLVENGQPVEYGEVLYLVKPE